MTFGSEVIDQMVDAVAVLGVDHRDSAVTRRQLHRSEHLVVRHHHAASGVGHEHLEGYDTHLDESWHLVLDIIVAYEYRVDTKIEIRSLVGLVQEAVDCVKRRAFDADRALVLDKWDDRSDAAKCGAERECLDSVGVDGVVVCVDYPWKNVSAAGVDGPLRAVIGQVCAHCLNLAVLDKHVFSRDSGAADQQAAGNNVIGFL